MSVSIRKTPIGNRAELDAIVARLNVAANAVLGYATITNGTTAGKLRTTAAAAFRVDGQAYTKASTDDLWAFAAEAALTDGQYRAYWLYVDAAGAGSIERGTVAASATLARAGLSEPSASKSVFGVFTAGSAGATDFTAALTSQGAVAHGIPADACVLGTSPNGQAGLASVISLLTP